MMPIVFIGLGIWAAVATHGTVLFVVGLMVAVMSVWSNGVITNYPNALAAPGIWVNIGTVCVIASVVLIPLGYVLR